MNYIKEINSFYDWLLYNPLPTGAIALWNALMSINNKAGWADEFTVANLVLQGITGLSRQGLDNSRNLLMQKGLIKYKKGTSNQAGRYKIIGFDGQKVGTVVGTKESKDNLECKKIDTGVGTKESKDNLECKKIDTGVGTEVDTDLTQEGHNSSTLNKLNKTKLNDINNSTSPESNIPVFDDESSELVKLYQSAGIEVDGFTSDWITDSKEKYGFEWVKNAILEAANQGVRNRKYINRILNNWKSWGGMKLSTDKKNNPPKIVQAKKTRFHNFEQRSNNYTAEELDEIAMRKRREYLEQLKNQGGDSDD